MPAVRISQQSPASEKISVFRSLFRGREDVYPRRFESRKTGKSGYAPACAHEWVRGICEKPRVKCGDCPHRSFLPVTDDIIRWHLSGHDDSGQPFVAGVYPIRLLIRDERCAGEPLDVVFCGELRPEQLAAANALLAHDTGVLAASTAFGKTVIAAWMLAQRRVSTLVLVHRQQLLDQWGSASRRSSQCHGVGLDASAVGSAKRLVR